MEGVAVFYDVLYYDGGLW